MNRAGQFGCDPARKWAEERIRLMKTVNTLQHHMERPEVSVQSHAHAKRVELGHDIRLCSASAGGGFEIVSALYPV